MLTLSKRVEQTRIVLREAQGDEPEAFVVLDPITPKMRRRALRAIRPLLTSFTDSSQPDPDLMGDVGEKVSRELIRMGLVSWGGIGGDDGKPLDLTPDQATRLRTANDPERPTGTIDLLLDEETVFDKIDEAWVRPDAIRRAEKNGLSGSPNGTSTAAMPGSDTANLAAKPKRRASAAKRAPTAKTNSKRKPAKASGKR
jgi:hypothetical protein